MTPRAVEASGTTGREGADRASPKRPSPRGGPGADGVSPGLLHPALRLLLTLEARAMARQVRAQLSTVRGVLLALFLTVLGVGGLVSVTLQGGLPGLRPGAEWIALLGPWALLVLFLTSLVAGGADQAIGFSRAEVLQLYPAPLPRRQLVRFKLLKSMRPIAVVAPLAFPGLRGVATTAAGAALAGLLSFGLLSLATSAYLTARSALTARLGAWWSRGVELSGWAGVGLLGAATLPSTDLAGVRAMMAGPVGWTVLAVPRALTALLTVPPELAVTRLPLLVAGLLAWAAVLVVVTERLDGAFLDVAKVRGARIDARREAMLQGRGAGSLGSRTWRVPLPWLPHGRGVGPLATTRLAVLLRKPGAVAVVTGMTALGAALTVGLALPLADAAPRLGGLMGVVQAGFLHLIVLPSSLRLDFRGELDRIATYRSLPLSPWAVVWGQLLPVTAVLVAVHVVVLGVGALATPSLGSPLLWGLFVVVPLDLLAVSLENVAWLLYPTRTEGVGPTEIAARQLITQLGALLTLSGIVGVTAGVGAAAGWWLGSVAAGVLATAVGLVAWALLGVVAVRWAYLRFDPSDAA